MSVYNTEKYVTESIESILAQTYSDFELICVDDGSTDRSVEIVKGLTKNDARIVVVELEKNGGIGAARNAGLRISRGEYIAFADADDIWKEEKLAEQMHHLTDNPDIDISFCMIQNFISPELSADEQSKLFCPTNPLPGQISGTFLVRKSSFDNIGLLDTNYRVGEFIDWMARANNKGLRHAMINQVLYLRRAHTTNTTNNRRAQLDYLKIVKSTLDRKRSSNS